MHFIVLSVDLGHPSVILHLPSVIHVSSVCHPASSVCHPCVIHLSLVAVIPCKCLCVIVVAMQLTFSSIS